MLKTDCFASGLNGVCTATHRKDCEGCKFYKSNRQFRGDFKRSKKILADRGGLSGAIENYPVLRDMCAKIG